MKNKAQNDPKAILKTAENLIVKSGLWASGKPNGNKPSGHPYFDTTSPPPALLENGFYTHQDHEDMKFDTLEKAIARLNHDVTELKSIDELTRQQTKVELGHVRRDQDAKFLEIRQSVKQISVEMDALKKEVQEMRGLNLAPGFGAVGASNTAVAKPTGNVYVKVALQHNRHEVHEFPTDESGNLSFTAVNAVYPGINALKFEYKENNSIRLCMKNEDKFEPPEDGWGDRLYFAHSPVSQTADRGMSLSAPQGFAGHPLFPGLYSATNHLAASNLANPFSTSSMFK